MTAAKRVSPRMAGPAEMGTGRLVVVMGVSGSGKTTIGRALAQRLGVPYAEADSFHPPANVAKMAAGQALGDDDRYPWLAAIAAWLRARAVAGDGGVVSCSALKYQYRELLREGYPGLWFLHLVADRELVIRRVADRQDHFMPVSLVDTQLAAVEPLRPDEAGVTVDASAAPEDIVRIAVAHIDAIPKDNTGTSGGTATSGSIGTSASAAHRRRR